MVENVDESDYEIFRQGQLESEYNYSQHSKNVYENS